jgi:hypothetical protein
MEGRRVKSPAFSHPAVAIFIIACKKLLFAERGFLPRRNVQIQRTPTAPQGARAADAVAEQVVFNPPESELFFALLENVGEIALPKSSHPQLVWGEGGLR